MSGFSYFGVFYVFSRKSETWKNADFLTRSGGNELMDLTFRDFGINKQSDLSIATLNISFQNIDFS